MRTVLEMDDELAVDLAELLAVAPRPGNSITATSVTGIHNDRRSGNVGQQIGIVLGDNRQEKRRMPRR